MYCRFAAMLLRDGVSTTYFIKYYQHEHFNEWIINKRDAKEMEAGQMRFLRTLLGLT
jgi:hypothetical protein